MSKLSFDPNVIVAELVKSVSKDMMQSAISFGNKKFKEIQVDFETCFSDYLVRTYEHYSKAKTLVHGDRPVSLREIYVVTDFEENENKIPGSKMLSHAIKRKKTIVFGTAGAGKSMLVKKLFLDLIDERTGYIPILIELRSLSQSEKNVSIESLIFSKLRLLNDNFTLEQLKYALKQGKFFLFFDGFDEISPDSRSRAEEELLNISYQYTNSLVMVTSRFDESIKYWNEFYNLKTVDLTQSSAIEIVSRIDYDETVKCMFIEKLKGDLFSKHNEFLSNPLLLTIMLLTYESMAEIPDSMHIFYEQAFLTLYHRHDATKRIFKRKLYAELPVDKFKKIFATFCAFTYCASQFKFSRNEILKRLKQAIDSENIERVVPIEIDPEKYLKDLIESVCLVQQDGHEYIFVHRSFQEYFTAVFVSTTRSVNISHLLEKISRTSRSDKVIDILFEINTELIEKEWIKPKLDSVMDKLNHYIDEGADSKAAALFTESFATDGSQCADGELMGFTLFIYRKYVYLAKYHEIRVRPYSVRLGEVPNQFSSNKKQGKTIIMVAELDPTGAIFEAIFPQKSREYQLEFLNCVQSYLKKKYEGKEADLAELLLGNGILK